MALIQPNIPEMEAPPPLEAGVVNEPMGDLPTEGGVESVEDDIPTTAKEGDFILPYESVLYVGLNNINIEVKKAMKQAQQEGVQIEGADPDSDIPIKISNFEYRIPKELVEYIGMQRLETYREKGLELRAQLEKNRGDKEKAFVPPPQEPQQMAQAEMPPMQVPQEQAMPPQDMPPQAMPPMMQTGGMVQKPSGETLHSPGQGSPLQSPSPMQKKKEEEKKLLDMQDGGLVKKKELNEGGVLPPDFHTRSVFSPRHLRSEVDSPYKKFKGLPPANRGSLEASYGDSRLTKKPKIFSSGPLSTKVDPKYQGGSVNLNIPVNNKYITSIGGGLGGGRSREKVKQSFLNDPVYEQVVERVHRNAALQLGLNPENLPLNLKNIELAYNDYKEVLKNTVGEEVRGKNTGYGVEASFQTNPSGELILQFNKYPDRSKRGYIGFRSRFQDGGRAEEIKTLVEGGHDVEFMMNVEPYIKNDMLAQYGSEIKEPMMDPKAKPKDMFSTANIRLGDRRRLAGSYLGDRSQNMKEAGDIIKEIKRQGRENEPDSVEFIKEYNRRKAQTPYDRVEERAKLGEKGLRDKPESFMPAKDASFVSLRQSDHIIGTDSILDSEGNPHLTDPVNTAVTFIHEARHKAVQKLNLRPLINKTLDHILNVGGGAEEVLMRFMDYKNATTPEEKVNQKKWVINFYDMLNNVAKNKGLRIRFTDPFQDTTKGEQEFEKLDQLSSLVNTVAKEKLEELRGVPVYEDKDYPESLSEQIDRKGIFRTMFSPSHFEEALKYISNVRLRNN